MTARVSIIMRTKDRPHFLVRALKSVTSQQFSDWELVVVNDGGARRPVDQAIAALNAQFRARIRVLHHDRSLGRWESANAGIGATSGELVILHDDDDAWHRNFLVHAVAYLTAHPDRVGIVSRIMIVWEEERRGTMTEVGREQFLPDSVAPLLMEQQNFNHFVPIAFLYRRTLHEAIGLYDASLPVIGDWLFNTKALELGPLEYLGDTPLVYWHQRRNAAGPSGNSVIAERSAHALHDALIRDAAFREATGPESRALVLYFERRLRQSEQLINDRFDGLEARPVSRTSIDVLAAATRPLRSSIRNLFGGSTR